MKAQSSIWTTTRRPRGPGGCRDDVAVSHPVLRQSRHHACSFSCTIIVKRLAPLRNVPYFCAEDLAPTLGGIQPPVTLKVILSSVPFFGKVSSLHPAPKRVERRTWLAQQRPLAAFDGKHDHRFRWNDQRLKCFSPPLRLRCSIFSLCQKRGSENGQQ